LAAAGSAGALAASRIGSASRVDSTDATGPNFRARLSARRARLSASVAPRPNPKPDPHGLVQLREPAQHRQVGEAVGGRVAGVVDEDCRPGGVSASRHNV
jgi:hypothetical protein